MKPTMPIKKSPYEAYKNFKVFKDFFNIKIIEDPLHSINNYCDHKYKAVKLSPKYSSKPEEIKSYNRFDDNNFLNKFPFQNIEYFSNKLTENTRSKEDLNSDLRFIPEQPEYRVQTSIGNNRCSNPALNQISNGLVKPGTSPHGTRLKGTDNRNKYYTLIEEAMRMTTDYEKSKYSSKHPLSNMQNSCNEMVKSSSGQIKISKFNLTASSNYKL